MADAYHSLSIEGYSVTPALVERARSGKWNPDGPDQKSRDAMAAKGYSIAHNAVKASEPFARFASTLVRAQSKVKRARSTRDSRLRR